MMKVIVFGLLFVLCVVEGSEKENEVVEGRGKAKYALIIHFFYVVATKLFVLKIIYGALFYVLLTKGWHFVLWFVHYLKKNQHHEYIDDHSFHDHHVNHIDHDSFDHQPYGYDSYGGYKKRVYDADGSYSVQR